MALLPDSMNAEERDMFGVNVGTIDWVKYISDVHIPGVWDFCAQYTVLNATHSNYTQCNCHAKFTVNIHLRPTFLGSCHNNVLN
jgi:hypothetical protein